MYLDPNAQIIFLDARYMYGLFLRDGIKGNDWSRKKNFIMFHNVSIKHPLN